MIRLSALIAASLLLAASAAAQPAPGATTAVGVVRAERRQITQTDEFIGRVQAVGRVALVARVTAFLEKRLFVEGSEVKQGDLLYLLEQAPFRAQVDANKATVDQLEATVVAVRAVAERALGLFRSLKLTPPEPAAVRAVAAGSNSRPETVTNGNDADFLQVLLGQVWEDPLVNLVVAECRLVFFEAQAPQPDHDVHASVRN